MRVALIHYWLVGMRGGEKVLEALGELFPQADIYCHVCDRDQISEQLRKHTIRTTFIQRLPRAKRYYQRYLPLMPLALEQIDLRDYDLVISSESGPAKGIIARPDAMHICYCHTPMRYVWDMYNDYLRDSGMLSRALMRPLLHYLRMWDVTTAARVDQFVANSKFVSQRIQKYYRRSSRVIHPPVDTNNFAPGDSIDDFYLAVGQLVPYKCMDLAVEAFNRMRKPLIVIGGGQQLKGLRERAGPTVEVLGWQSSETIQDHYARCKALVSPGVEDFGMVPVEAMASGRPVIAVNRGGAVETVVDGVTGVLFDEQTVPGLIDAVERFEALAASFSTAAIREHAERFDRAVFKAEFASLTEELTGHHPGIEDPRLAASVGRG